MEPGGWVLCGGGGGCRSIPVDTAHCGGHCDLAGRRRLGRRAGSQRIRAGFKGYERGRGAAGRIIPKLSTATDTLWPPALCRPASTQRHRQGTDRSHALIGTGMISIVGGVFGPLRHLIGYLVRASAGKFALKRAVVGVGAEVLQVSSDLGVFCLLTAAPHA